MYIEFFLGVLVGFFIGLSILFFYINRKEREEEFYDKKRELGEIIFPIELNKDRKWYNQVNEWGVVTELRKGNKWERIVYFECYDSARVYSELIKLKKKLTKKGAVGK